MADLKEARKRLEEIDKKREEAVADIRRLEAQPKMEIIKSVLMKNDSFCEKISGLAKDELRIFAKVIAESSDELFQKAEPEIEASRRRREEKVERQKERRRLKKEAHYKEDMEGLSEQNDDDEVPSIEEYESDSSAETGTVYDDEN